MFIHQHRELNTRAYESLREQIATAIALCSDEQVLDIADALHDTLRRRRATHHEAPHFALPPNPFSPVML